MLEFKKIITAKEELPLIPIRMLPLNLNTLIQSSFHFWSSSWIPLSWVSFRDAIKNTTNVSRCQAIERKAGNSNKVCPPRPYSLDLAQGDFWLFRKVKKWTWNVSILNGFRTLRPIGQSNYRHKSGFLQKVTRMVDKCVQNKWKYFKGDYWNYLLF